MKKYIAIGAIVAIVFTTSLLSVAKANVTGDISVPASRFVNYQFFASTTNPVVIATSTSATSTNITPYFDAQGRLDSGYLPIAGAKKVTLYFGRTADASGNAGSSAFRVEVTPDGTNWFAFNKLVQNVASSTNPGLTLGSVSLTGTSTVITSMDLQYDNFYAVRCIVVRTTDGAGSCLGSAQF